MVKIFIKRFKTQVVTSLKKLCSVTVRKVGCISAYVATIIPKEEIPSEQFSLSSYNESTIEKHVLILYNHNDDQNDN